MPGSPHLLSLAPATLPAIPMPQVIKLYHRSTKTFAGAEVLARLGVTVERAGDFYIWTYKRRTNVVGGDCSVFWVPPGCLYQMQAKSLRTRKQVADVFKQLLAQRRKLPPAEQQPDKELLRQACELASEERARYTAGGERLVKCLSLLIGDKGAAKELILLRTLKKRLQGKGLLARSRKGIQAELYCSSLLDRPCYVAANSDAPAKLAVVTSLLGNQDLFDRYNNDMSSRRPPGLRR